MRFLFLLTLISSSYSFAGEYVGRKLNFTFSGGNPGHRVYYRCEFAKALVEKRLKLLGALGIQVKCYGGLEDYRPLPDLMPIIIRAKFEAPMPSENSATEEIEFNSRLLSHEDCFINVELLKKAIPLFPGAKIIKQSAACLHNESRWSYVVEVMK